MLETKAVGISRFMGGRIYNFFGSDVVQARKTRKTGNSKTRKLGKSRISEHNFHYGENQILEVQEKHIFLGQWCLPANKL